MTAGALIRDARLGAGLTQEQLARRSATSQATLSAYESESRVPSASTLARILAAAGRRLTTRPASAPVVTPARAELERRGRILVDVLALADRLPARRRGALRYPRLRSSGGLGR
jgi:transcriptional regulator with XRE-family HTH domain